MPWLEAAVPFNFRGRRLNRGERFEASDEEAADLCAPSISHAKRVAGSEAAEVREQRYDRQDLRAESLSESESEPAPVGKRKRYKRRDLGAKR